jgi:hypothetical protein
MSTAPVFFLPHLPSDRQEATLAHIAAGLKRAVPPIGQRVYSISFESDGTLWVATVGDRLRGRKAMFAKRKNIGWGPWFDDPSLVIAVLPGAPYFVVAAPDAHSHFRDEAFAATPIGITLFSI